MEEDASKLKESATSAGLEGTVSVASSIASVPVDIPLERLYGFSRAAELDDLWSRQLRQFYRLKGGL